MFSHIRKNVKRVHSHIRLSKYNVKCLKLRMKMKMEQKLELTVFCWSDMYFTFITHMKQELYLDCSHKLPFNNHMRLHGHKLSFQEERNTP